MQQLSSFRLFCSPPLIFRPKITQKPLFIIRALASSGSREKRTGFPFRKSIGTQRSPSKEMEETEKAGFNRKRAEGRDNSSKQKILQLKTRKLNPVNTISYVQILGTGMDTQDTSPSVLLFFDKQRFIFNAGEGLQRFCTEHKIKLSKIDHMFLTRVCSETAAGVPGLLLTLAGMGDEGMSVNIWGPSDLKYLMDAMTFIPNAAMVHTHRFGSTPDSGEITNEDYETDPIVLVDDEVIKLSAILLRPGFSNELQNSNECSNLSSSTDVSMKGNIDQLSRPLGGCSQNPLTRAWPQLKPGDVSVIYACELPEIKGKFDPAKAAALGLKAGPKYRELQLGNSVKSDRQNIMVHPSDVLGPSIAGPIVLLVDCPTVAHLREMLSLRSLKDYYVGDQSPKQLAMKPVNCVIHLGPAFVTTSPDYCNWMKKFGEAQHIMAGHTIKNIETPILKSSARIMSRLNFVCPQFFPSSGFWSSNSLEDSLAISEGSSILSGGVPAENLLKFHLRPYAQLGLDRSGIPSAVISSEIVTELLSEIPEVKDVSKHVSLLWGASEKSDHLTLAEENSVPVEEPWMNGEMNADAYEEDIPCLGGSKISLSKLECNLPRCLENIAREDMEIVFLGTGSSQPSKYRNVSSIYINLFSKGSLFLDCGEGTLGQLKRRFGATGADDAIRGLKCIWISHIHADHHTGLARVLAVRSQLLKGVPHDPLLVVGPRQLKRFLDAYARLEDIDMEFLDCRDTSEASWEAFAGRTESEIVTPENVEATLFAKDSKMESFWKRPRVQVSSLVDFPVLKRLKQVLLEAGLEVLISFPVVHCPQAYGIVLKASERVNRSGKIIPGWKLVYSGDTRPCQALIDAAHGATILIHEATFEDGMVEEAIARNHSTTKEAIDVGDSAGAYRIILTHFSQRYPKIPVFDESHMHKTCIAFDMMSVNIADLPILPKVLPYLKLLFRNEMVLDEPDGVPLLAMEQ